MEENPEMNLDLNFGPDPVVRLEPAAASNVAAVLSDVANEPFNRVSDSLRRFRTQQHESRSRQVNSLPALAEIRMIELNQLLITSANGAASPAGTGERVNEEDSKNGNKVMEQDSVNKKKRDVGSSGSFYDCYICMELSKDPVVTTCGHLYCWSCLYRWLQVSEAKECPVCKGEVSVTTLTPIYGRGRKKKNKKGSEEVSDTNKIPSRPQARRVERVRSRLQRPGYVYDDDVSILREILRQRAARMSAERLLDTGLMTHVQGSNQERDNVPSVGVEDRDSLSSVIGVMNSGSQVDTAGAEIDSVVSVSSSVGRPHENGSRVSDVDSADSRPVRRRRLA